MESIKNEKFQKLDKNEMSDLKGGKEVRKTLSTTVNGDGTTTKLETVYDTKEHSGYRETTPD